MYEKWQMNRLWLTQIYLYRWYIPDLVRLANTHVPLLLIILIAVKLFALLIQVQIYLAVLAIANSFRKLCLTATENYVA